jgi:glycerol-1-phosphate dehydrogenase [NAD(P)+]
VSNLDLVITDDLEVYRATVRHSPDAARLHSIGLKEVVRGRGAMETLPDVMQRVGVDAGDSIVVLSDTTPKSYHGGDVMKVALKALRPSFHVTLVKIEATPPAHFVRADEATIAKTIATTRLDSPRALVSVGSGTVVDIGKVVAHHVGIPHVVVQTAASVNGFSDNQSVLLIEGVKRTTPSRWPDALIIDPWVVAEAPLAMTRSGLGDELSMFSASADWYLASALGFDASYSPTLVTMMRPDVERLTMLSRRLGHGDHEAVDLLASCLTAGGLAMGVAGRTAPSSGTEHLISHVLEMRTDARDERGASHGSQVGVASVFAALLWQQVRTRLSSGAASVTASYLANRERVENAFAELDPSGAMAEECWRAYSKKAAWIHSHLEDIQYVLDHWSAHDDEVATLLKPAAFVASTLCDAGAPATFAQLDPAPDASVVLWAISNCHLMRDRFSVIDLAELIGEWNIDHVAALLAQQDGLSS